MHYQNPLLPRMYLHLWILPQKHLSGFLKLKYQKYLHLNHKQQYWKKIVYQLNLFLCKIYKKHSFLVNQYIYDIYKIRIFFKKQYLHRISFILYK